MTRPTVKHDGFLIPNAGVVANPKMAEPDQIDFNILGNDRWGVIEGCLVTVSGTTASTLGGTAVVNGVITTVKNGSASLAVGAAQDRFDLIVTDESGTLKVLPGITSTDPLFADPEPTFTVLAAVFAPAGSSSFVDNVIDKRHVLSDALLTKLDPTKPLVQNVNGVGNHFLVRGDGQMTWDDDAQLLRTADMTLQVNQNLVVASDLAVGDDITADAVTTVGRVASSNLRGGTALPGSGNPGDLFQNTTTGRIYLWQNAAWQELATISGAVPVGAIIQSVVAPSVMTPLGWVALSGQPIQREQYPHLFDIPALSTFVTGDTMVLPDASQRVLLTDFTGAGRIGGASSVVLSTSHLPSHNHSIVMGSGGIHDHAVTISRAGVHSHTTAGGDHTHGVNDPGHSHNGADYFGNAASFISVAWGGKNKIDAMFNDKSHTYSVEPVAWTLRANAGIAVTTAGSGHGHTMNSAGDHDHLATVSPHNGHTHPLTVQSVGAGTPVPIQPPYLTVFTYIRS